MKTSTHLKKPFGTAKMVDIAHVRYVSWEDAFDVEFEDGLSFLEPHRTIRKANQIARAALPVSVEVELKTRSGFFVHYDNGQTAEVSWRSRIKGQTFGSWSRGEEDLENS